MTDDSSLDDYLPLKPAHFHILLTVLDRPVHGYGIRQEIDERTDGQIVLAAGTLYETLGRMERDGLVEEVEVPEEDAARASTRWRFYYATARGKALLRAAVRRMESDLAVARAKLPATG